MSGPIEKQAVAIDCRNCVHFYVTWDLDFPRGCRAMGFKTSQWPWLEVLRTSGEQCLRFQAKPTESRTVDTAMTTVPVPGRFSRKV